LSLRSVHRWFTSARATVILLCLLALLLLLHVALPQASVIGDDALDAIANDNALHRFVLVGLGFGRMPTSPVFLTVLSLFFLNLLLVLLARIGPTVRRIALKTRSEKGLQAWARLEESLSGPLPKRWSAGHAARTLRDFGYQVRRPGQGTFWGVKHRTAPLGFLLFHLSFFLLCGGGMLIYYTRFVGSAILCEKQEFAGDYNEILRQPPLGAPPDLRFSLERVEPRFERGEPVHLGAVFRFQQAGAHVDRSARVNDPARWGTTSLLVHRAGLAPVLWLQDSRGFTLDRIVTPVTTRGGPPTRIPLGDGALVAVVAPLHPDAPFPSRRELADTALRFVFMRESGVVFDGKLRPGEAAQLEGARIVLEELRYWVGVRVISERGGGLLIAGFVAGVAGLIWRLLWYRREIAVTWDDRSFHVVGRSEYFSGRFREELRTLSALLERGSEPEQRPRNAVESGT
jgi:hypothetical protein